MSLGLRTLQLSESLIRLCSKEISAEISNGMPKVEFKEREMAMPAPDYQKRMRERRKAMMWQTLDNIFARYLSELQEFGKQRNPRTPFGESLWGPHDSSQKGSEEPDASEDAGISRS